MDCEALTPIHKVHLFLLNDTLLITTWLPQRRGTVKYRFEALYELDSLAVVNARDVGPCKNAFKILMFPDTRMFQADNPKDKRKWLDILDATKRKKSAEDTQRKEAASLANTPITDPTNPFAEPETPEQRQSVAVDAAAAAAAADALLLQEEWLQELPEDLDVTIAQRDFEGAVDLVEKVSAHLSSCPRVASVREYRARVEQRVKLLTSALMHELQLSPERSIRGGPRSARRAVTQLIRLGKSAQACELFLHHRSAIIRYNLRQLKTEGATAVYIRRLAQLFFSSLTDTGTQFVKAFPQHYGCFSAFVLWSQNELESFVKMFTSQVFAGKTNFSTVAECVHEARSKCKELEDIGLELLFILDGLLAKDMNAIIQTAGNHQIEAIRHRASNDTWELQEFISEADLHEFETDMIELKLRNVQEYSKDERYSYLTENTTQFSRSYLRFTNDILKLTTETNVDMVSTAFVDIITCQLQHSKASIKTSNAELVKKNVEFLYSTLFLTVAEIFEEATDQKLPEMNRVETLQKEVLSLG